MITRYITKAVALAFGALVYTLGLDVFLTPNHVIDGGVVGISLMAAALTNLSFSTFIVVLNLPFLYLGYKKSGLVLPSHPFIPFYGWPYGAVSLIIYIWRR